MERINFAKLSGAGNDFIVIDNRRNVIPENEADFVRKVCARRVSVGADGLLLVEDSDIADFKMRYFNSDGSEVETCGNGARCIARFAHAEKVVSSREMRFETRAGVYSAQVMEDSVKLRVGDAVDMRLNFPLRLSDGSHTVSFVNTGVPHVVFFVNDLDSIDVVKSGRETRYHSDFQPEGTNANFVEIHEQEPQRYGGTKTHRHGTSDMRSEGGDPKSQVSGLTSDVSASPCLSGFSELNIRTYERGVEDETLACGTGCIAAAIIAAATGKARSPVAARTRGGYLLKIYFRLEPQGAKEVFLEGDARTVCRGYLLKDSWS
jgi:diaminopimelate epimerase